MSSILWTQKNSGPGGRLLRQGRYRRGDEKNTIGRRYPACQREQRELGW